MPETKKTVIQQIRGWKDPGKRSDWVLSFGGALIAFSAWRQTSGNLRDVICCVIGSIGMFALAGVNISLRISKALVEEIDTLRQELDQLQKNQKLPE